jgi:SAM-dependent methyltransferase
MFILLDAQSIPFPQAHFDLVIANFMLYHVPDRARALAEIYRVLKPGGRLYAATNGKNHMREIDDLIRSVEPRADLPNPAEKFGLENGREQLSDYFQTVTLNRFEDSLRVIEIEPLINYILSLQSSAEIQSRTEQMARLIREEIETRGAYFIRKEVGMFTGVKLT